MLPPVGGKTKCTYYNTKLEQEIKVEFHKYQALGNDMVVIDPATGTSASAAAGAAIKTGRCNSPTAVRMPGGKDHVAIDDDWQVILTGSVEAVCHGVFAADLVAKFGKLGVRSKE